MMVCSDYVTEYSTYTGGTFGLWTNKHFLEMSSIPERDSETGEVVSHVRPFIFKQSHYPRVAQSIEQCAEICAMKGWRECSMFSFTKKTYLRGGECVLIKRVTQFIRLDYKGGAYGTNWQEQAYQ